MVCYSVDQAAVFILTHLTPSFLILQSIIAIKEHFSLRHHHETENEVKKIYKEKS